MGQDQKAKAQEQVVRWEIAKTQDLLDKDRAEGVFREDLEGDGIMSRPCKRRRVRGNPNSHYFKPAGIRKIELEEIILAHDEFEALRLKDLLMLDQNECAQRMEISQPTFHRLLTSARKKVADAIVNGKAINIRVIEGLKDVNTFK